nr:Initiation factor 2B related domain containing protein [Haemonchus contortus]CDJ98368.1 Initiation factor 2B related domain containing protein [Haemonchus contortus]
MAFKPVKAIFKPSQQRGRDVAVYVLPEDPDLCMEFSFKRFNTSGTIASYVCIACRALKDRAPKMYGVVPTIRIQDGYFLSDPALPEHAHFCEPRNFPRSMMRREIIAKFNEIRESMTEVGSPEEVEEDLLQAINKPEYAHFGDEERQEMVKQLVMGHIGGRDTLRSMIRTNKKAKRRRTQFEFPEDAPPPVPLKIFRNYKHEVQGNHPVSELPDYAPSSPPLQPPLLPSSPSTQPRSCKQEPSANAYSHYQSKPVPPHALKPTDPASLTEASIWVEDSPIEYKSCKSIMTPAPSTLGTAEGFSQLLAEDPMKSTGLAAIETLLTALENSNATTVNELNKELTEIVSGMAKTDHSSTSIRSASDLFRRFITLAPAELLDQRDFSKVLAFYRQRGKIFINRVAKSRGMIARHARPFFKNNMNVLTHSYSKVVLETLITVHRAGTVFHVWVTESQPDGVGQQMQEALRKEGIDATLILDSAVGYLMERIDMVAVGAEGVMETGGIINKIGTLNIAIIAKTMNKPFFVMAESIKFVKEYPLNQADIPEEFKYRTSTLETKDLSIEHPMVDYTSPQYINLLFTDLGILTPAAVGEELIKLYT